MIYYIVRTNIQPLLHLVLYASLPFVTTIETLVQNTARYHLACPDTVQVELVSQDELHFFLKVRVRRLNFGHSSSV